jgi:amino acid adenylation domain-containing protein
MKLDARVTYADCGQDVPGWMPFVRRETERTVFERFERIATAGASRVAVVSRRESATYGELHHEAKRISRVIDAVPAAGSGAVATLLDSDVRLAAAMLAAFRSGRCYVPIDGGCPVARGTWILDDIGADVILTEARHEETARAMAGPRRRIVCIDRTVDPAVLDGPPRPAAPDAPLWVMFTSGSTGVPKGVVQTHRNILQYVRNYANGFRLGTEDRLLALMRLTVNGGCHDALMTLLTGGTLQLWDVRRDGLHLLPAWIAEQATTILSSAPTVFRHLARELAPEQCFGSVRLLKLWGEPSYRRDFDAFCRHFRDSAVLVNRLGSNEQGSTLWYFLRKDTTFEGNDVPVGFPTEDNAVRIVADDGADVNDGEIGEIVACSRYLSPGYLSRDDLTRAVFSNDAGDPTVRQYRTGDMGYRRPDGCVVCVGRKDGQIKIRGYRIELAEIERVLLEHPDVADAVVIGRADARAEGEQRLVAYIVAKHDRPGLVASLRAQLRSTLPDYMWPAAFARMDRFPQAENGKVARRALPDPGMPRPELEAPYRAPASPTEHALHAIWLEVLRLDDAGVDDPFLDLGGNSLQAAQIVSLVRTRLSVELPVADPLSSGTIAAMARSVEALSVPAVSDPRRCKK